MCPVSKEWVNSNQVRINAAIICIATIIAFVFVNPFIILVLSFDFFIRGIAKKPFSFLNVVSNSFVQILQIGNKKENKAPKQFAAAVGFVMSAAAIVFFMFGFTKTFLGFTAVIILFSFLESVFSFCAGCGVYTLLVKAGIVKN